MDWLIQLHHRRREQTRWLMGALAIPALHEVGCALWAPSWEGLLWCLPWALTLWLSGGVLRGGPLSRFWGAGAGLGAALGAGASVWIGGLSSVPFAAVIGALGAFFWLLPYGVLLWVLREIAADRALDEPGRRWLAVGLWLGPGIALYDQLCSGAAGGSALHPAALVVSSVILLWTFVWNLTLGAQLRQAEIGDGPFSIAPAPPGLALERLIHSHAPATQAITLHRAAEEGPYRATTVQVPLSLVTEGLMHEQLLITTRVFLAVCGFMINLWLVVLWMMQR